MIEAWTPELRLETRDGQCRLDLAGITYGHGRTLQEAANDLLARVFDLALGLRAGYRVTSVAPLDPRVVDFLWEIGEIAIHGGDVRMRVLGAVADLPTT
jgi:hypothetical protein